MMKNINYKRNFFLILLFFGIILSSFKLLNNDSPTESKDRRYQIMIHSDDINDKLVPYKVISKENLIKKDRSLLPKVDDALQLIANDKLQRKIFDIVRDSLFLAMKDNIVGTDQQKGKIIDDCISTKTTRLYKYVDLYKSIRHVNDFLKDFIEKENDVITVSGYCVNNSFKELYFVDVGFLYQNAIEVKSCNLYNPMSYTVLYREINNSDFFKKFKYENLNKLGYYENKYSYKICIPVVYNENYIADILITYLK